MNPFKIADELIKSSFRVPVPPDISYTDNDSWVPMTLDKAQQTISLGELLQAIRSEYIEAVEQLRSYREKIGIVYIVQTIHIMKTPSWTEIHGYFATNLLANKFLESMKEKDPRTEAKIYAKKVEFK